MGILRVWGLVFLLAGALPAQMQPPEDFLGFEVGTDRKLADMYQIIEYFQKLDWASDRGAKVVPAEDCWHKSLAPLRCKLPPNRPRSLGRL